MIHLYTFSYIVPNLYFNTSHAGSQWHPTMQIRTSAELSDLRTGWVSPLCYHVLTSLDGRPCSVHLDQAA